MEKIEIQIHDIKPLIEIEEYSLYYLLGLSALVILLACGVAYLAYKWYKKRKAFNIRKEHKKLLSALNFKDTKKSAYAITFYGATFKDDSPRHVEMFQNLTQRLEDYKYKKSVEKFDKDTLGYIELYKDMLDV